MSSTHRTSDTAQPTITTLAAPIYGLSWSLSPGPLDVIQASTAYGSTSWSAVVPPTTWQIRMPQNIGVPLNAVQVTITDADGAPSYGEIRAWMAADPWRALVGSPLPGSFTVQTRTRSL